MRSRSGVLKVACPSRLTLIISSLLLRPPSAAAGSDLLPEPRNHLVENGAQRRGGFEPEQPLRLVDRRDALLHIIGKRLVGDIAERLVWVDLLPNHAGEREH